MPRAARYAVVMAGGAGTRFWPRSRAHVPKQFLAITGRRSMLQETIARVSPPVRAEHVVVVAGEAHARLARRQLGGVGARLLLEPRGRNTAPAIAWAALEVARTDPQAVLLVLPADHAIPTVETFRADLALAADLAERTGALVTLGIPPAAPETGFGYIEPGDPIATGKRGRAARVARFVEKPPSARARRLVAGGALWNAGIFAWRADAILAALDRHLPAVLQPLARAVARGGRAALRAAYARVPSISIDYGVLEHAENVAVVRARFAWSDVGTWAAVEPFWRTAGAPNAARGRVVAVDASGCVVDSPERLVALLGVQDLVVVDTPDVILVCPKTRAQEVRALVDAVRARGWKQYL